MEEEVARILDMASRDSASDVHFTPFRGKVRVQVRTRGMIQTIDEIGTEDYERLMLHMRYCCELKEMDQRRPQSGMYRQLEWPIRVAFTPTFGKIAMSWRLPSRTLCLTELLPSEDVERFHDLLHRRYGLIALAGATGVGKTTVLYAVLEEAADRRIVTIESPPEREIDGVVQLEVNELAGLSHRALLKETLRTDPDVIVIGEVRTSEELQVACDAALSGHLTFMTFHASTVNDAKARFEQLGGSVDVEPCWCVLERKGAVSCRWSFPNSK